MKYYGKTSGHILEVERLKVFRPGIVNKTTTTSKQPHLLVHKDFRDVTIREITLIVKMIDRIKQLYQEDELDVRH
jgi:hypothetical protein